MKENYADVLESYIIQEPAEEGFIGASMMILGHTVLAFTALPFVAITGIMIVAGVSVAAEARKLKKQIRKNKGKCADYGAASNTILRAYSSSISEVQEPKSLNKHYQINIKAFNILKEACVVRDQFNRLDPTSDDFYDKCKTLESKLVSIEKKINAVPEVSESDIKELKSDELITTNLQNSMIMKLSLLDKEVWEYVSDGYNNDEEYNFISDDNMDFYDKVKIWKGPVNNCHDTFKSIFDRATDIVNSVPFIQTCKFAVNPKAKKNK